MSDLVVNIDSITLDAAWVSDNPKTRQAIVESLPLDGDAAKWGEELYFRIPVDISGENTQRTVPVGAIAYWPQGNALCVFWGPTPASIDDEPRAASPVSLVAQLEETRPLAEITGGAHVHIERA